MHLGIASLDDIVNDRCHLRLIEALVINFCTDVRERLHRFGVREPDLIVVAHVHHLPSSLRKTDVTLGNDIGRDHVECGDDLVAFSINANAREGFKPL